MERRLARRRGRRPSTRHVTSMQRMPRRSPVRCSPITRSMPHVTAMPSLWSRVRWLSCLTRWERDRSSCAAALPCRWRPIGRTVGDRGHGSVLALGMLFAGVLLLGVTSDVARLVAAWREASHVAHTAAETGAGWVQSAPLYEGSVVVDPLAAEFAALESARGDGRSVDVRATTGEVCVSVEQRVAVGISRLVGGLPQRVSVTACASPRQG